MTWVHRLTIKITILIAPIFGDAKDMIDIDTIDAPGLIAYSISLEAKKLIELVKAKQLTPKPIIPVATGYKLLNPGIYKSFELDNCVVLFVNYGNLYGLGLSSFITVHDIKVQSQKIKIEFKVEDIQKKISVCGSFAWIKNEKGWLLNTVLEKCNLQEDNGDDYLSNRIGITIGTPLLGEKSVDTLRFIADAIAKKKQIIEPFNHSRYFTSLNESIGSKIWEDYFHGLYNFEVGQVHYVSRDYLLQKGIPSFISILELKTEQSKIIVTFSSEDEGNVLGKGHFMFRCKEHFWILEDFSFHRTR